jgi:hypothetical protein
MKVVLPKRFKNDDQLHPFVGKSMVGWSQISRRYNNIIHGSQRMLGYVCRMDKLLSYPEIKSGLYFLNRIIRLSTHGPDVEVNVEYT